MDESLEDRRYHQLFGISRSILYHDRRRAFFEGLIRIVGVTGLVAWLAVAIVIMISGDGQLSLVAVGFGAALAFGVIVVVATSAPMQSIHRNMSHRFSGLERRLHCEDNTEDRLNAVIAERLAIEVGEPPTLRVLDSLCHNELVRDWGCDDMNVVRVTRLQRWLSQVCDVNADGLDYEVPTCQT